MILRIGNDPRRRGFTLIEILLTVSIVALASVFITQANLMNGAVYGRYVNRLEAQNFAAQKIWEIKETILQNDFPAFENLRGDFRSSSRTYRWEVEVDQEQDKFSELYKIRMEIHWSEGGAENSIERYGAAVKVRGGLA